MGQVGHYKMCECCLGRLPSMQVSPFASREAVEVASPLATVAVVGLTTYATRGMTR